MNDDLTTSRHSLNVLALPSPTTILFALIFLVIGAPILLSAVGRSVPCGPAIIVCIVAITTWDFLGAPERHIQSRYLIDANSYPQLSARLHKLAMSHLCSTHAPRLLVSSSQQGIYSFGTFSRHYIVVGTSLAHMLETTFGTLEGHQARADAILLHELAHFKHGDVWKALLSRSLLRVTALFFLFSLISTALIPLLYHHGARFYMESLPTTTLETLRAIDPETATALETLPEVGPQAVLRYETYILSAHWPLIVGALLLLILFWRRLLRVRELYADARVVDWQSTSQYLLKAIPWLATITALQPQTSNSTRRRQLVGVSFYLGAPLSKLRNLLTPQPSLFTRHQTLQEPYRIYGSPLQIAWISGLTVILLNLTLSSLFSSRFIRNPNATLPLVVGFTVMSASTLPLFLESATASKRLKRSLRRATIVFTLIRIAPQILVGALLTAIVTLDPQIIDEAAYILTLVGGENLPPIDVSYDLILDLYVLRPLIFSILVLPALLYPLLLIDILFKRKILTWYGSPLLRKNLASTLWAVSAFLSAVAALGVIPLLNALIFPTAHSLLSIPTLVGYGVLAIATGGFLILFRRGHRDYARRCPACNAYVPGFFYLGRCCEQCGHTFHPQLLRDPTMLPSTLSPQPPLAEI